MEGNKIVIKDPKAFVLSLISQKMLMKINEFLAENKIKNKIEQLMLK